MDLFTSSVSQTQKRGHVGRKWKNLDKSEKLNSRSRWSKDYRENKYVSQSMIMEGMLFCTLFLTFVVFMAYLVSKTLLF